MGRGGMGGCMGGGRSVREGGYYGVLLCICFLGILVNDVVGMV